MRAIAAILGAIAGAVLGYIGAFVVGYPIVVALDGPDRDGGIAMGVAVTLGPAMAVIGALLFLFAILRLTRPKPATAATEEMDAAPLDPDEALLRPPPGSNTGPDTQTLIATIAVVVLIVAGVLWLRGS